MWETSTLKIKIDDNEIEYNGMYLGDCGLYKHYESINIHELAHKCKEWAKSLDYRILSGYDDCDDMETWTVLINHRYGEGGCSCDDFFEAETESEAIFQACQWILDNKGK
jgi:hypothetical protein